MTAKKKDEVKEIEEPTTSPEENIEKVKEEVKEGIEKLKDNPETAELGELLDEEVKELEDAEKAGENGGEEEVEEEEEENPVLAQRQHQNKRRLGKL